MNCYLKFHCRHCGTVFRHDSEPTKVPDGPGSPTPEQTLRMTGMSGTDPQIIHKCSPRIAGVADFAGVEFSEE